MTAPRPAPVQGEPYAKVTRAGRWSWEVDIHLDGEVWVPVAGRKVLGSRKRAERQAQRELIRYRASRNPVSFTIADRSYAGPYGYGVTLRDRPIIPVSKASTEPATPPMPPS